MNVLSLFDGISCGRVALERVGIKVNKYYRSEIDKYANLVAKNNYPDSIDLGDVNNLNIWDLDNIDLLLAGFPCQSYSYAGKKDGLKDQRGQLIYRVFDCLKKYNPKIALLENVKGLLTHAKGATLKYILQNINKCGYAVDWQVINSSLLSAQNRERVYIYCKRLDQCQGKEYSIDYDKAKQTQKESPNKRSSDVIQPELFMRANCENV